MERLSLRETPTILLYRPFRSKDRRRFLKGSLTLQVGPFSDLTRERNPLEQVASEVKDRETPVERVSLCVKYRVRVERAPSRTLWGGEVECESKECGRDGKQGSHGPYRSGTRVGPTNERGDGREGSE